MRRFKVAIIGGGFTGLSTGAELVDRGCEVTIFEAGEKCGGLASGFKPPAKVGQPAWKWSLEVFYHHIFTGDRAILDLAKKVEAKVTFSTPLTSSFFHLKETQLDSPISLLRFSGISFWDRVRMGVGLAVLKIIPNGEFLEKYLVVDTLPKLIGREGYTAIWEKLLKAKFGPYVTEVNMAWFWSRVAKRSQKLGYFDGGFQELVEKTVKYIEKKGGRVVLGKKIGSISGENKDRERVLIDGERFDAVVITTPASSIAKMVKGIDFPKLEYLWGQTLVLETSKRMLKGYWLNILENNWPFLVMVEHTNFIDKKNYGGNRIVYLGNYLPDGHKQLAMSKDQLLKLYTPFIKKVFKGFRVSQIKNLFLFRSPFAQPVFPVNYSKMIPPMRTNDKGIYIANMSMVYPFDRGTNYAVKMGVDVARAVMEDLKKQ